MAAAGKNFRRDYYTGLKGIYFRRILRAIVSIGQLRERDATVLDFGCGTGRLKEMLPGKVIGYDILPELSDVRDWRDARFDVFVANEVFYLFQADELRDLLRDLRALNPKAEVIVGISRQGFLNRVGKYLGGESDAHLGTQLQPREEMAVLREQLELIEKRSVWTMCDVCLFRFRSRRGTR